MSKITTNPATIKKVNALIQKLNKRKGHRPLQIEVIGQDDVQTIDPSIFISTGSPSLDIALGGGFTKGAWVEIYGNPSCGKTTLALLTARECLNKYPDKIVVFFDFEASFKEPAEKQLLHNLGLGESKRFLHITPATSEEALEALVFMWEEEPDFVSLMIYDTVAAAESVKSIEQEFAKVEMGTQARANSQNWRKLLSHQKLNKSDTLILLLNQVRLDLGVMMGDQTTTLGGKATKFYSNVRIHMMDTVSNKWYLSNEFKEEIGKKFRPKITKNKIVAPFRETLELDYLYNEGYDITNEVITLAKRYEVCDVRGAHWYYASSSGEEPIKLASSKNELYGILQDNPELFEELHEKVMAAALS